MPTETNNKTPTKHKRIPAIDKAIIETAKTIPDATTYQIGKALKDKGKLNHIQYVYQRLNKSDYLRTELGQIKKFHVEFVQRELLPEALKIHKRVLKSRKISDLKKKDWVFAAEKMGGLIQPEAQTFGPPTINIKQLQMMVQSDVATQQ